MFYDYPCTLTTGEVVSGTLSIADGAQIYNNVASAADDILLYRGEITFGNVGSGLILDATQKEITGWYDDGIAVDKYIYDESDESNMVEVAPRKTTEMTALKAAHGVPPVEDDGVWDVPKSKTVDHELVYTDESVQEGKTVEISLQLPAMEYERNIDVVFVMDRSSSAGSQSAFATNAYALLDILAGVAENEGVNVRVGVVKYRGKAYDMVKAVTQEMAGHSPDLSMYGAHEGLLMLEDDATSTLAQKVEILKAAVQVDKSNWFFSYSHEESAATGSNIHGGLQMGKAWLDADTVTAASDKFLIMYTDGLGYQWAAADGTSRTTYSQFALDNDIGALAYGPSSFRSAKGMPQADQRVLKNKYYADDSGWIPPGIDVLRFGPAYSGTNLVPNMEALLASTNAELTSDGPYQTDTLFKGFAYSIATNDSWNGTTAYPIENATAANGFDASKMAPYKTYYKVNPEVCADVPYLESTPYVVVEQGGSYFYANVDNGNGTYSYDATQPDGIGHFFVNSNFFMLHPTSIEKGVYMLGKAYEDALKRGYHCALFWENNTANQQVYLMGEAFKQWARAKSEYECLVGSASEVTAAFSKMNTQMVYLLNKGKVSDVLPGYFELVMDGEGEPLSERPFKVCLDGVTQNVTHAIGDLTWYFGTPNANGVYPYEVSYDPRSNMQARCDAVLTWKINVPVKKAEPVQLCYKLTLTDLAWALEAAKANDGKIPTNGETALDCSDSNGRRHKAYFTPPNVGAVTTNSTVTYEWSGDVPPGHSVPVDTNLYPMYGTIIVDTNYTSETVIDNQYAFSGWSDPPTNGMQAGGVTLTGTWRRVVSGPVFSARMLWTPEVADASGLFYGRLEVTLESGDASQVGNAWFVFTDRDNESPAAGFDLPYYAYLAAPGRYAANYAATAQFSDGAVPSPSRYSVLDAKALAKLSAGKTAGFGIREAHRTAVPIMPGKLAASETVISAYVLDCVSPAKKVVGMTQSAYLENLVVAFVYQVDGQWYLMKVLGDECTAAEEIAAPRIKKTSAKVKPVKTTVTLNPNGGKAGTKSVTATKGLGLPAATAPTKAGCQLIGFYSAKTGGVKYYDGDMKSERVWTSSAAKATLYARWKTATAKIVLDPNGGVAATKSVTATYGKKLPAAKAPTRTGYVFQGFFTAKSGGSMRYNSAMKPQGQWKSVAKSGTLYAHWKVKTAKVSVNANGGAFGKAKTKAVTATYGKAMPSLAVPVRNGWRCVGIFNKKSGGTMYWDAKGRSARNWNGTGSSYTFYAQWARIPYALTVKVGGELAPEEEADAAWAAFDGDAATAWQAPDAALPTWDLIATYSAVLTAKDIQLVEDEASADDVIVNVSQNAADWTEIESEDDLPAKFRYLWLHFDDAGGKAPFVYEVEVQE